MNESPTERLATDLDGAFESLVREHQDRLYALALRYVRSPSDAEELTQDAFVKAHRALERYDAQRVRDLDVRPWLTTILLNACRNHVVRPANRGAAASVSVDAAAELAGEGCHGPEARAERRESAERWAGLVAQLPPAYRAAVLLRHLDGMPYDEMAVVLGRPEGTLKAQVHRGVALLRAAFEADERAIAGRHLAEGSGPDTTAADRPIVHRQRIRSAALEAAS